MGKPDASDVQPAPTSPRALDRFLIACGILGIVGVLGLARYLNADPRGFGTHEQLGFPPCLTRHFLGIPCPFCGMTTAFALMAHGRPVDAFLVQPAGALAFLAAVAVCAFLISLLLSGRFLRGSSVEGYLLKGVRYAWIPFLAAWIYKIVATLLGFS